MKLSMNASDPLLNSSEEVTTTEGRVKGDPRITVDYEALDSK